MNRRHLVLPCLLLAFALAACGGGSEEAQVEEAIQATFLSGEPLACTEPITAGLHAKLTKVRKDWDCAGDEASGDEEDGDSGAIDEIEINDSTATAQVTERNGAFDGTLEVALVLDDGEWKLDELVRVVGGPEKLRKLVKHALTERDEWTAAQRRCMSGIVDRSSDEKLEDAFLRFQTDALILEVATACPARTLHGSDEEQVEETIEIAVLSTDPYTCGEVQSQRYLEENYGKSGLAAVYACRAVKAGPGRLADEIEIVDVTIHGATATATAVPSKDGTELKRLIYSLAKEDGRWKLARLERWAQIDRRDLAEDLKKGAEQSGAEITATLSACIDRSVREMPRGELESLLRGLLVDPQTPEALRAVRELLEGCFDPAS